LFGDKERKVLLYLFNHFFSVTPLGIIARLRRKSSSNRSHSIRNLRRSHRFYLDPLMDFLLVSIRHRFNSPNNNSPNNNSSSNNNSNSNRNLSVAIIIGPSHRPNLNTISSVTQMDRNRGTIGLNNCWYVSSRFLLFFFVSSLLNFYCPYATRLAVSDEGLHPENLLYFCVPRIREDVPDLLTKTG
jgi:hypothetical protein